VAQTSVHGVGHEAPVAPAHISMRPEESLKMTVSGQIPVDNFSRQRRGVMDVDRVDAHQLFGTPE
jgi:hypothetical protein